MALGTSPPASRTVAGQRLADAYKTYAATAQAPAGPAAVPATTTLQTATTTLAGALAAAFGNTTADASASAMTAAYKNFWTDPLMSFNAAPPAAIGAVTTCTGDTDLYSTLKGMKPYQEDGKTPVTADEAATKIADALDTLTKTVTVSSPVPGGSPIVGLIS